MFPAVHVPVVPSQPPQEDLRRAVKAAEGGRASGQTKAASALVSVQALAPGAMLGTALHGKQASEAPAAERPGAAYRIIRHCQHHRRADKHHHALEGKGGGRGTHQYEYGYNLSKAYLASLPGNSELLEKA